MKSLGSRNILSLLLTVCLAWAATSCERQQAGDPKALLASGWSSYRFREFDSAAVKFQDCLNQLKQGDARLRQEALYGFATARNSTHPDDPDQARPFFHQAIDVAPEGVWAPWAALALVRIDDLAPDAAHDAVAIRRAYQQVIDRYPSHPAAEEALLYQQASLVETFKPGDSRQAADALEQFVQSHPHSLYRGGACILLASCYSTLHLPDQYVAAMSRAIDIETQSRGSTGVQLGGTIWRTAVAAEFDAGDLATARKFYRRFIADYPSDRRAWPARQALVRMDATERSLMPISSTTRAEQPPGLAASAASAARPTNTVTRPSITGGPSQ